MSRLQPEDTPEDLLAAKDKEIKDLRRAVILAYNWQKDEYESCTPVTESIIRGVVKKWNLTGTEPPRSRR